MAQLRCIKLTHNHNIRHIPNILLMEVTIMHHIIRTHLPLLLSILLITILILRSMDLI
jgi:hypothetical protein